jgi:hypothetical protein
MPKELYLLGAAMAAIGAYALMNAGPTMKDVKAATHEKRLSQIEEVYRMARTDRANVANVLRQHAERCSSNEDMPRWQEASKKMGNIVSVSIQEVSSQPDGTFTGDQLHDGLQRKLIKALQAIKSEYGDDYDRVAALGLVNIHFDSFMKCTYGRTYKDLVAPKSQAEEGV